MKVEDPPESAEQGGIFESPASDSSEGEEEEEAVWE
jgi:hypothetical protein